MVTISMARSMPDREQHLPSPLGREAPPRLAPRPTAPEDPMSSFSRSRLPRREASRERALSALGGGVRLKSETVSGAPSPTGVAGADAVSVGCRTGDWSTLDLPSQYGYKHRHLAKLQAPCKSTCV